MCHAILQDIKFFEILSRIDNELAAETHAGLCQCGGTLYQANYPRKPRGFPNEKRPDHASRFSFCCRDCRKRSTSVSVRFLCRRVYRGADFTQKIRIVDLASPL
ncbi:TnmB [Collimonas pratensis]|uniref:TnmB n=1 Tax=Collimonas pratensis TaxID=279113 RepID=A0ABN4M884_9BURK|nr:TnmB [Collimonas pratensis]